MQAAESEGCALGNIAQLPVLDSPECGNSVIGGAIDLGSEFERRLAVGGQLACQLRTAVKDRLGECTSQCSLTCACNCQGR